MSPNFWYWPFFQYRVKEHNGPCACVCSICAMILVGGVITVMQRAVLLAHKHVPSTEEVMFTLDLKLKSLAGNSIRSICLLWQECMFCVSRGMQVYVMWLKHLKTSAVVKGEHTASFNLLLGVLACGFYSNWNNLKCKGISVGGS